ncbi:dirigent protein 6-like [Punica granatum]|uniref:Dirigent protein n=2 Tax=Punica granatum TaxID=22663 RepID=A0A218WIB9_PUNGR|nr:dirigent protein 6-like [Punica granatum]OWM72120.1 hypothetical protein CDL15_Pgr018003 [Punica granatum]PKI56872.1 hypothetical protein CRG98_022701 [Punica granatum]
MRRLTAEKFSLFFFLLLLFVFSYSVLAAGKSIRRNKPCNRLVLHLHEIIRQGNYTFPNATSAAVTKRVPGLGSFQFGEMYVFDNLVTRDANPHSPQAARARGFYVYDGKDSGNDLYMITLSFNSTEYTGTLTILGTNNHSLKTRDLPVVGGTGDFFMARGVTTLEVDVIDFTTSYFRLKMDIKLYECY